MDIKIYLPTEIWSSVEYGTGECKNKKYVSLDEHFEAVASAKREAISDITESAGSVSLCKTCVRANRTCPIYPQETKHCVEYQKK